MTETPTGASPLEPLPTFHGQEGLCCYLSSPWHFTQPFTRPGPYPAHLFLSPANSSSWEGGDLGVMPMPAALQGKGLRRNPAGAAGEEQEEFRHRTAAAWMPAGRPAGLLLPTCVLER